MLTNTHSVTNHRVDLFSMLAVAEGFGTPGRPGLPYFDSVGKATIGYGFNLEDGNVARLVLAQLDILAGKSDSQVRQIESDLRTAINAGRSGPLALEASLDALAQSHGVAKFKLTDKSIVMPDPIMALWDPTQPCCAGHVWTPLTAGRSAIGVRSDRLCRSS